MKFSEVLEVSFWRGNFWIALRRSGLFFLAVYVQRWIFWMACLGDFCGSALFYRGLFFGSQQQNLWLDPLADEAMLKVCQRLQHMSGQASFKSTYPSFAQASVFSAAVWKKFSFTIFRGQRFFKIHQQRLNKNAIISLYEREDWRGRRSKQTLKAVQE